MQLRKFQRRLRGGAAAWRHFLRLTAQSYRPKANGIKREPIRSKTLRKEGPRKEGPDQCYPSLGKKTMKISYWGRGEKKKTSG